MKITKKSGFTLTELLVTLAVLGMLVAVGAKLGQRTMQRADFTTAINTFVADYNFSRMMASRDNRYVAIDFNDNGLTLYPQPLLVYDDSLADALDLYGEPLPKIRHLQPDEMVLMSIPPHLEQTGYGWLYPFTKNYYLNSYDIQILKDVIGEFNNILNEIVQENTDRLVLADIKSPLADLATTGRIDAWGIPENYDIVYIDGLPLKADQSMNSIYSYDGLHFNPRGNAYVTNLIIRAVNQHFGSDIKLLKVNQFMGNTIMGD